MGNLATLLTVALVCAAFGFVAGSMLTSIWIDRHSKPVREKRKSTGKDSNEFARILQNSDMESMDLEIDGKKYTSYKRPPESVLEKLNSTHLLLLEWFSREDKSERGEKRIEKPNKMIIMKSSDKELKKKSEEHDMLFEINNIIQEKLKNLSDSGRKIHLAREGTTGISFWVGENSFKTIDDIPDKHIRDLIKGSVAEWETHVG